MRILGIDPGTRLTGYGCVELRAGSFEPRLVEAGVLTFKPTESIEKRLAELHAAIVDLITELAPARIAIEKLYSHYAHPRTAIIMAHARGVILLAAQQSRLEIEHLPSTEVKKAVTGNGHASKNQVQLAVQSQFRLAEPPEPPDVADAIAIALTSGRRYAYAQPARRT